MQTNPNHYNAQLFRIGFIFFNFFSSISRPLFNNDPSKDRRASNSMAVEWKRITKNKNELFGEIERIKNYDSKHLFTFSVIFFFILFSCQFTLQRKPFHTMNHFMVCKMFIFTCIVIVVIENVFKEEIRVKNEKNAYNYNARWRETNSADLTANGSSMCSKWFFLSKIYSNEFPKVPRHVHNCLATEGL